MILAIENLNISFLKNNVYIPIIRNLHMEIAAGEMLGVIGESGSGKSLTNLALMGLLPNAAKVEASRLEFKNRDLLSFTHKEWQLFRGNEVAIIFQNSKNAMNPSMKIKTQLIECIKKNNPGLSRNRRMDIVADLLEQVGLSSTIINLDGYPHELSSGVVQRLMIAMALASNPSLLIADEITTGLDLFYKRQILQLLDKLRREKNMAVLIVSHDVDLIQKYTQRTHVMYSGELMESGLTEMIIKHPSHPYTKGLIHCLPRQDSQKNKKYLNTIDGWTLPITENTEGCRFYNRCSVAHSRCLVRPVIKKSLEHDATFVNCHLGDN